MEVGELGGTGGGASGSKREAQSVQEASRLLASIQKKIKKRKSYASLSN